MSDANYDDHPDETEADPPSADEQSIPSSVDNGASPNTAADDPDAPYREASDWGLDDLKASDEPVVRYITIGNRERRLKVIEATDDDVPNLDRQSENEVRRALAGFFREHIVEPESLSEITAEDIREMRVGVADKLLYAIIPERQGN